MERLNRARHATRLLLLALACALACARPPAPDPLEPLRQRASQVRGLEFREPVRLERVDVEGVRRLLRNQVKELYPPEDLRDYEAAYRALGTLPPGVDLMEALFDLQAQELAGVYVSRKKTMFVLREFTMGDEEGRLVVLHELVHALQDQHHPDIFELLEVVRHDDDLLTAVASVLEGDASLATLAGEGERDQRKVEVATSMRDLMLSELEAPPTTAGMPLLLRASLTFPYAHGTVLAAREFAGGGNVALDSAIDDPPLSSRDLVAEQREPVEFVELPWREIERDAEQAGCQVGHHNVAGALTIGVLFDVHGKRFPRELATEWRGDRFLHLRCPGGPELYWVTRWSTPQAAEAFARQYESISGGVAVWGGLPDEPRPVVQGRDVVVVTPEAATVGAGWLLHTRFRVAEHLVDWIAQGCTGEPACPAAFVPGG